VVQRKYNWCHIRKTRRGGREGEEKQDAKNIFEKYVFPNTFGKQQTDITYRKVCKVPEKYKCG
jgi:hypothetical protein